MSARVNRIWIIGAGAVGSALAALIERGGGEGKTCLVGRSPHWRAVREAGLVFQTGADPPARLKIDTTMLENLPQFTAGDLLLLTGKLRQLDESAAALTGRLHSETRIIALQNGLEVDQLVAARLERSIGRGLILFGARITEPGCVRYFPGVVRLKPSAATEALAACLEASELPYQMVSDFLRAEWRKLAINCLANPLAGILNTDNEHVGHPVLDPIKDAILQEVQAVARAEGAEVTLSVEKFNHYLSGPTGGNHPSLCTDLDRGAPTEIGFLNGAVVERGRKHGIPTPVNASVVSLVRFLEEGRSLP